MPRIETYPFDGVSGTRTTVEVFMAYDLATAAGAVSGADLFRAYGHNPDVDPSSDPEDVWSYGGLYLFNGDDGPQSLEIVSDNVNDDVNLEGAKVARVRGLDENGLFAEAETILSGTTPVPVPGLWLAVNRIEIISAGITKENQGNITCRIVGEPYGDNRDIAEYIRERDGRTLRAGYTVPIDRIGGILSVSASVGRTKDVHFNLKVRNPGGAWQTVWAPDVPEGTTYEEGGITFVGPLTEIKLESRLVERTNSEVSGVIRILVLEPQDPQGA